MKKVTYYYCNATCIITNCSRMFFKKNKSESNTEEKSSYKIGVVTGEGGAKDKKF